MEDKAKLKLKCPMCGTEFATNNMNKIWCRKDCSLKLTKIKREIRHNQSRQRLFRDPLLRYDFESDKFFRKSVEEIIKEHHEKK